MTRAQRRARRERRRVMLRAARVSARDDRSCRWWTRYYDRFPENRPQVWIDDYANGERSSRDVTDAAWPFVTVGPHGQCTLDHDAFVAHVIAGSYTVSTVSTFAAHTFDT